MLTLDLYWETKLHTAKWFLKSLSHAATSHHHWQGQSRPLKLCVHLSEHQAPSPPQAPDTSPGPTTKSCAKNCGGFRGPRHSCLPHRFMEA